MRPALRRFWAAREGNAATTYMLFTACWFLIVAAGVHFTTPAMTTKLQEVSKTLKAYR